MTPVEVVAGVLRHRNGGDDDATARRIVAALSGHQMLADRPSQPRNPAPSKPKDAVQRCGATPDGHPSTALVGNRCPICQWSAA